MPFDAIAMAAMTDEVRSAVRDGRIQKILQPSASAVALAVYRPGGQRWLLLSADAVHARTQLMDERLAKGFATPSRFVMLLRKYLDGARVIDVESIDGERVMTLRCYGAAEVRLTVEVMGRHSNIILIDDRRMILGALKIVTARQSRVRPIVPGQEYEPPPAQPIDGRVFEAGSRLNPHFDEGALAGLLSTARRDTQLSVALAGSLQGASPQFVAEIVARAGYDLDTPVENADLAAVDAAARSLTAMYTNRTWEPCEFEGLRKRDFAPYIPVAGRHVIRGDSLSGVIHRVIGDTESRDPLLPLRKAVMADIRKRKASASGRLCSLQHGMKAAESADEVKEEAQLILAYSYLHHEGQAELDVPDLDRRLVLDPNLSAVENAERRFRRYRKLRDARAKLPSLLESTRREIERLDDLETFAGFADSESALERIRRQAVPEDESGQRPAKDKSRDRKQASGPARYRLASCLAIVGRNARENEEVTFRQAVRGDIWLHVRHRTGAHVLLRGATDDEAIQAAAQLAAYFSESRRDPLVDVDVASPRHVHKIPGSAPGRVTYTDSTTVRVHPQLAPWEPV